LATAAALSKDMVQDILMLTTMQEGMLFHYWHREHSRFYCEQVGIELVGDVDRAAFETAWAMVTEANEMARAVIRWNEHRKAVQIIKREHRIPITYTDLSALDRAELAAALQAQREERLADRIDIREAPIRVLLCKLEARRYELFIDYHHIVMDGWSFGILVQEFLTYYEALREGGTPRVVQKPSFRSYVKWTKEQEQTALITYWKEYLAGYQVRTTIPTDRPKLQDAVEMSLVPCDLDNELLARMRTVCAAHKLSLASVLYTAWGLLLQKYNNTNDVCFGVTVSGRPPEIAGIEQMIGLFIQTVPMRMQSEQSDTPVTYARKLSASLTNSEVNGGLPLRDMIACSEMEGGGMIFDSVVVMKNYPFDRKQTAGDSGNGRLKLAKRYVHEQTNFDLSLQISVDQGVHIDVHYNTELYDRSTIQLAADRYVRTLHAMLAAPEDQLAALDIVTAEEMAAIATAFHRTAAPIPDCTIPALVWQQAERYPDRVAVAYEQQSWTYAQLMRQARKIAALLQENGAAPQSRVALFIPRSLELVAGVLGIMEAGCICVPLDVNHPVERTLAILEDCEASIVLAEADTLRPDLFSGTVLSMNRAGSLPASSARANNSKAADTAYMIYTSGSTGKPKGAMLHHRGIVNHTFAKIRDLRIEEHDVVGNNFSVNVVASIWQMLAPLFIGARLVIYAEEVERDPVQQFRRIEQDGVTVIEVIPSVLNAYIRAVDGATAAVPLRALKSVALTSEETKPGLVQQFYTHYDHIQLVNCYGQTECCDDTLHYRIPREQFARSVPIGSPIPNTRPYILDLYGQIQPLGMAGELCVVGAGVSYGYWNRPELNRDAFIAHPLEPDVTMYRTGDLAAWHADGTIRYMGRLDHQVKIRGNRIELNEVENGLARMADIREAAVVVRAAPRGEDVLWAFFTASAALTAAAIRSFMSEQFPSYMIPELYTQLEQMPLMPNGKINRHTLRTMEAELLSTHNDTAHAEGQLEERILGVWQRVLQREGIGATDSFFDVGGNSLLILELASQLSQVCHVEVAVTDLFMHATIRRQAAHIGGLWTEPEQAQAAKRVPLRSVPLPASVRGSGDPTESIAFETQVPAELVSALRAIMNDGALRSTDEGGTSPVLGQQPAFQADQVLSAFGQVACAALALLLSKWADHAKDPITLYVLHTDRSQVLPATYTFSDTASPGAWLRTQMQQQQDRWQQASMWVRTASLIHTAEDSPTSVRPVVAIHAASHPRAASSSYGHRFNLWVDVRASNEGMYTLAWGAPPGQWNREVVQQWIAAHMKLIAYLVDNIAEEDE